MTPVATPEAQRSVEFDSTSDLASLHPRAPRTLEQAGLTHDFVTQLILKVMHFSSDHTGLELARRVGLEYPVIEPVLDFLKQTHQCEVASGTMIGGPSYRYRITDEGRRRALYEEIDALDVQAWMTGTDETVFAPLSGRALVLRAGEGQIKAS